MKVYTQVINIQQKRSAGKRMGGVVELNMLMMAQILWLPPEEIGDRSLAVIIADGRDNLTL
jgi:hypothetical protein